MELTKEYFDEKLSGLATKNSLEELARMTAEGFAETSRQFLETAKQRSVEAIWRELTDVRKVIDRMFEQMDKNIELRIQHEEELLELRTRVEKLEVDFGKFNVQGI